MTENKSIMIDGVDVSGCNCLGVKLTKKYMCICDSIVFCKEEPNCYYKQLKRKEQECEKLKEGYSELTDIVSSYMDDFTGYNEELGGFDIVLCVKELMKQLDQLKASKEQAEQKLERIREMLKNGVKIHDDIIVNKSILQIIDEVE